MPGERSHTTETMLNCSCPVADFGLIGAVACLEEILDPIGKVHQRGHGWHVKGCGGSKGDAHGG